MYIQFEGSVGPASRPMALTFSDRPPSNKDLRRISDHRIRTYVDCGEKVSAIRRPASRFEARPGDAGPTQPVGCGKTFGRAFFGGFLRTTKASRGVNSP